MTYEHWDTPLRNLPARVASLRELGVLGANVTVPHKEAVIPLLDELGGANARMGAVNTIVNREGRLFGFNTDGPGFVAALKNEAGFEPAGKRVLLVGAGGAARGIAFALAEANAAEVGISNRTAERAQRVAREIGHPVGAVPQGTPTAGYDCVVNCTSVGMHSGPDPAGVAISLEGAREGTIVVDIVYAPEDTPLLKAAKAQGLPTLGGLPMLIYQGALSFEHWTGVAAPVEVMFHAARTELARRAGGRR